MRPPSAHSLHAAAHSEVTRRSRVAAASFLWARTRIGDGFRKIKCFPVNDFGLLELSELSLGRLDQRRFGWPAGQSARQGLQGNNLYFPLLAFQHFIDPHNRVIGQKRPLNSLKFATQPLFPRIEDKPAFGKYEIRDLDKPVQVRRVDLPRTDLIEFLVASETDFIICGTALRPWLAAHGR